MIVCEAQGVAKPRDGIGDWCGLIRGVRWRHEPDERQQGNCDNRNDSRNDLQHLQGDH